MVALSLKKSTDCCNGLTFVVLPRTVVVCFCVFKKNLTSWGLLAISHASSSCKAGLNAADGPNSLLAFVNFIGIAQHLERVK